MITLILILILILILYQSEGHDLTRLLRPLHGIIHSVGDFYFNTLNELLEI